MPRAACLPAQNQSKASTNWTLYMAPALPAATSHCQGGSGQIINNHHLSLSQNPNPNLSPNPNFNNYHDDDRMDVAASDSRRYVTFNNISAYSRRERRELRRRLILELQRVRNLDLPSNDKEKEKKKKKKKHHHHPPPPPPPELRKLHAAMMTKCRLMLTKLMKQKGAISWFNSPVDVVRMGLPDYKRIIKNPMDLGTVKSKLAKGFYTSPLDFASDVRLAFNNALVYNPQGHQVHRLADQLLAQFEALFAPAYAEYDSQRSTIERDEEEQIRLINASSWNPLTAAPVFSREPPLDLQTKPWPPSALELNIKGNDHGSKTTMSIEEKQNLSYAIQNLPPEKMGEVVEIVRKRNETSQEGDEVEIDFEVMDNQTLWELDRFVTNWNHKMMMMMTSGKNKRGHETMANVGHNLQDPLSNAGNIKFPAVVEGGTPEAAAVKKSRNGVDKEVDAGDGMPATRYPSVEMYKASSSSSSDSSSSRGSDSGSSSDSDSDEDEADARSPAVHSRGS